MTVIELGLDCFVVALISMTVNLLRHSERSEESCSNICEQSENNPWQSSKLFIYCFLFNFFSNFFVIFLLWLVFEQILFH